MEWTDEAIVLGRRTHGEHAAIATLFTRGHGRHLGLARGGGHGKSASVFETGNLVSAFWRARLVEHLGNWTCELVAASSAALMDEPAKLEALSACAAILDVVLPEREPHEGLFDATKAMLARFDTPQWREAYVLWEVRCLADLGFGLDLESCAATGVFITGWNPFGKRASAAANDARNRSMARILAARGYTVLPHQGIGADGDWAEDGFFVRDMRAKTARNLARAFGQLAIVAIARGRKAELVWV